MKFKTCEYIYIYIFFLHRIDTMRSQLNIFQMTFAYVICLNKVIYYSKNILIFFEFWNFTFVKLLI